MSTSRPLAADPRVLRTGLWVFALGLVLSLGLHLGVVVPYAAWDVWMLDLPDAGDPDSPTDGTGTAGEPIQALDMPVQIAVYEEPRPSRSASPPSTSEPQPQPSQPAAGAGPGPEQSSGEPATGSGDEEAEDEDAGQPASLTRPGEAGAPPRGNKRPCETIDEIEQINPDRWKVQRSLLDYYATHLKELDKHAGVVSHRDADGKRDGAKLYLPRCSILKQGGFRHGDVIHSVNGRKVNTIPQAISTYMALRGKNMLTVELTRRNGEERTHKYHLR